MNKVLSIVATVLFVLITVFGIYLTLVAYDKKDMEKHKKLVPKYLIEHVSVLKWLGPTLISLGVVGVILHCCMLPRLMSKKKGHGKK